MNLVSPGKNSRGNTMEKQWIEFFNLWAETEEYHGRIQEAKKVIEKALKNYKNPYISYSGGKDSTVMLHMVLQQKHDISVWHWDYGDQLMPRDIEEEVLNNAGMIGAEEIIVCKRQGDDARTNSGPGYKQFFGTLKKLKEKYGWDLGFVGVRQEESRRRTRIYKSFFKEDNCYPLLKLTWKDIWAYIVSNELPYASVYDKYLKLNGYDQARLVTFFDKEFDFGMYVDCVLMPEFRND